MAQSRSASVSSQSRIDLEKVVYALRASESSVVRQLQLERRLAEQASKYLHNFPVTTQVRTRRAYKWMPSGLEESTLEGVIESRFSGFMFGLDIDQEKMGDKWYMHLLIESISVYIPLSAWSA